MEYSPFFYGYYNGTFSFEFDHVTFDYPLAFFLVMASILFINMAAIIIISVSSMKKHIKRNVVKEDGHLGLIPVVFGSWNFSQTENVETQKNDVVRKILEMLAKLASKHKKEMQSADEKRKLLALRILINLTIIGLFGGLFVSIYYVYNKAPQLVLDNQCTSGGFNFDSIDEEFDINLVLCFAYEYLPSIVVTMANIAGPIMIFYLISYEKYEENTALLLSLGWCIFLR
jgi:hypothetical protein